MELFYYCIKSPTEDRQTNLYVPHDPIEYDKGSLVPSEEEEEVPTFAELNESLQEDPEKAALLTAELSPVEEDPEPEEIMPPPPEIIEPEFSVNLMKRNNSRKFKTPSFKWKKKNKSKDPEPYNLLPPQPSAPELTFCEDPSANSNLDIELPKELDEKKISLDSLTDQLKEKDQELSSQASIKDAESEGLKHDVDYFKDRLKCAEELLQRYKEDNHMLHQRCEIAERERGAMQHGNHMELEKIRQDYEAKLNELSLLPEKLRSAEAKSAEADGSKIILQNQVADQNRTINDLNRKIDVLSEQIGKLKDKFHSVNEDNIELNNKSQSHERKMMEADLHNKNLMDLVNKKDDTIEQQQPSAIEVDGKVSPSTTDNNASESEEKKKKLGLNESESETETESTASSEEEVDWSEMLKNAEANRERLGLDDVQLSDGESSVDEEGNRYIKKKATNGFSTHDMINRMATNELLGYDEFGRPISGKGAYKGVLGGKSHKNRAMLFGMDNGKRSKKIGSNNRGAGGKDRSRSGGRRNKGGKGGNMALLGF